MRITPNGGSPIQLVDHAVGDYQPIPAIHVRQRFDSYAIEGGVTKYKPHGSDEPSVSPQNVLIEQATDVAAQVVLKQLHDAVKNAASDPFAIQWNDYVSPGPFDGQYHIEDLDVAEVESEYAGRIYLKLSVIPVV